MVVDCLLCNQLDLEEGSEDWVFGYGWDVEKVLVVIVFCGGE